MTTDQFIQRLERSAAAAKEDLDRHITRIEVRKTSVDIVFAVLVFGVLAFAHMVVA